MKELKNEKKSVKRLQLKKISIAALNNIKGGLPPNHGETIIKPDDKGNTLADCSWTGCNGWACKTDYC